LKKHAESTKEMFKLEHIGIGLVSKDETVESQNDSFDLALQIKELDNIPGNQSPDLIEAMNFKNRSASIVASKI